MHVSSNKIDNHSTQQKLINTFWSQIVERQVPKKRRHRHPASKSTKVKENLCCFVYKTLFAVIF